MHAESDANKWHYKLDAVTMHVASLLTQPIFSTLHVFTTCSIIFIYMPLHVHVYLFM